MYKISDYCVCCHNCAMECPMGAISYDGLQYQIDQDKCVECGLCEKLCHTGACAEVDKDMDIEKRSAVELECDLVVCGAGSGIVGAVRAAQLGKKVILIEKAKKIGGNTDYAHGFSPYYSKLHEKNGFDDLREEAAEALYERSNRNVKKELIVTALNGSTEFFDWLCDFPNVEENFTFTIFDSFQNFGTRYGYCRLEFPKRMYENLLCRDQAIGPGWSGTFVKHTLMKAIRENHLDIEILTEHEAAKLLTDENGNVTGVMAETPEGQTIINAKAVILATGGMGRSDEKMQKYFNFFDCETPVHRFSVPTDTGDGIDLLQDLGVEPDPEKMFASVMGPAHHPFSFCVMMISGNPAVLSVNQNGERWNNEAVGPMGDPAIIAAQPKEISWNIMSEKQIDEIAEGMINNPQFRHEKWIYEGYKEEFETEINLSPFAPVKKADSLEGLAALINVNPEKLKETVLRYNEICKSGKDTDFDKPDHFLRPIEDEGPYYAIYNQRFSEAAFGGIRVNTNCEVLREDETVIPGLYAGGDATSAMHHRDQLAVISELTWATASSFIAGNKAVKYIDNLKK
jgi:succinate dehydrogenase/fumarate reductase flavoprotein subunit/NAD-dependent dihydropyrimidine dehydrogenase PreA subunit